MSTAREPGPETTGRPPAPARTRVPVAPVAVAGVAIAVAIGAWFATQDGQDPAAAPEPPATTSAPSAPSATGQDAAGTDAAQQTEPSGQTDPSAQTASPGPAAPTPDVARPGSTITVNGAEITVPQDGEFAFPTGDDPSWVEPLEQRGADGPYAIGEVDAPVVMLMYSEFQCPFCRRFSTETMPELMPFVEEGTLRIVWRDFPYLGPESSLAALGGRTAAEQDMFWEFHDEVFALGASPNTGAFTEDSLADVAESAGLDREQFAAGLNTIEQQEEMLLDQDEGLAMGVVGTPSFLINGIPIRGAQPTELFVQAVQDAAAARAQG